MEHPKDIGDRTTLAVMLTLREAGLSVCTAPTTSRFTSFQLPTCPFESKRRYEWNLPVIARSARSDSLPTTRWAK
jgi:hypothetical protein